MEKNDIKRDFEKEKYKDPKRFLAIAMISDRAGEGAKTEEGIEFVVPLFEGGIIVKLKNITLVTSLVNTCKSESAVTGYESSARKYTEELNEAFENLDSKIQQLRNDKSGKYSKQNLDCVAGFLEEIKNGIPCGPGAEETLAGGIYVSNAQSRDTDLPRTLERINPENLRVWAVAIDGLNDDDKAQIVKDRERRNPVQVFLGEKLKNFTNGSDLASLIGKHQFRHINDCLMKKLKTNDFSQNRRDKSPEKGGYYYLSYFVQSLLQCVLIDNENKLGLLQLDSIGDNWLRFLSDLKNPKSNLFSGYKCEQSEVNDCPKEFVKFMLNKLLGDELLKELGIGEDEFKQYAMAAIAFSDSLASADHANQIITMAFNNNANELTYKNSLFIGHGRFIYAPLDSAYKNMKPEVKEKLRLLSFQLKHKKIDFNQEPTESVANYQFGCPQEIERNGGKITNIRYKTSKHYKTDITAEDFADLIIKVTELEKQFGVKFDKFKSKLDNNTLSEKDITGLLDLLSAGADIGITLTNESLNLILKNEKIMKKLYNALKNPKNAKDNLEREKCEKVYKWLVNEHKPDFDNLDKKFYCHKFIDNSKLHALYNSFSGTESEHKDKATFILELGAEHSLLKDNKFISKIERGVMDIMFSTNTNQANKILKKIVLCYPIKEIDFGKWKVDKETLESIVICRCEDLLKNDAIKYIDFSTLDARCSRLVLSKFITESDDLNLGEIPKTFLQQCPLEVFEELTPEQFFKLMKLDKSNAIEARKDYLQNLCIEDLFMYCKNQNKLDLMTEFLKKYGDSLVDAQLLSIRGEFISNNQPLKDKVTKVYEKSSLNKNIGQIMNVFGSNDTKEDILIKVLFGIKKESEDEFRKVIAHLLENHRTYHGIVDQILFAIRNDETGVRDSIHKILLSGIPSENKKYINCLDLSRIKLSINQLTKKKFLIHLSDEQINNIQLGDKNISYEDLKNIIDRFGSRISHSQLEKLIEDYNGTAADSVDSKQRLIKIALISNVICDKENSFKKNYGQMFDCINELKTEEFSNLVGNMAHVVFATDDERTDYMNACKKFDYDNGNNKSKDYTEINKLLGALSYDIKLREDEMKKENANKKTIAELNTKIDNKVKQLQNKLSAVINQIETDIKKPSEELETLCYYKLPQLKSQQAKEEIEKLRGETKKYQSVIDRAKSEIQALESLFIKFKHDRLGWYNDIHDIKNKFFDVLKLLDSRNVNKTMRGITNEFQKLTNGNESELSSLIVLKTEKNEIQNNENADQNQMEAKKTFKEFFMDNFIGIQSAGKDPGDNFSNEQKGNLGIVNVIQANGGEKVENETRAKLTQYTPVYILNNLPFILKNCHTDEKGLDAVMRNLNLNNLTLKFESGEKQSLEKFVDSPLLVNGDDDWYFRAVKKLFCDHADNIVIEADLEFKIGGQKQVQFQQATQIGHKFNAILKQLTQKTEERLVERNVDAGGLEVFVESESKIKKTVADLDPKSILDKMTRLGVDLKRLLFFCGDWICSSKTFRSDKNFLSRFKSIVRERIDFGLGKNFKQADLTKCDLNKQAYDFLTGCTLLSGFIGQETEITDDIIAEICSLLTGKDKNKKFLCDDISQILDCWKTLFGSKRLTGLSKKIIMYMLDNRADSVSFQEVMNLWNDKILKDDCGFALECLLDAYPSTQILDILEMAFGVNKTFLSYVEKDSLKVTPDCLNKIIQEITQQLNKNPKFIEQKKDSLSKFFKCLHVDTENKDMEMCQKSLIDCIDKISSKEALKVMISVFASLESGNLKEKIFEAIVKNNKLGITLFDALSMFQECHYLDGVWYFALDVDFLEKYVMDVIKNYPGKIGESEVKSLEYFWKKKDIADFKNRGRIEQLDIRSRWLKLMTEKLPKGLPRSFMVNLSIDENSYSKDLAIKLNIQETKKLATWFEEGAVRSSLFVESNYNDHCTSSTIGLEDINNIKALFYRPINFDFNLDDYIKGLKDGDLTSENQRMIFLNLCCSRNENKDSSTGNQYRFEFDKFVKHIPKNSLGRREIYTVGYLLWLTNKRRIDLGMIKTLVEISSNVYDVRDLLQLKYQQRDAYNCYEYGKFLSADAQAMKFLEERVKQRAKDDIDKILSVKKEYCFKDFYVILRSETKYGDLFYLFSLADVEKIDLSLMRRICNVKNIDFSYLKSCFEHPGCQSVTQKAKEYFNKRLRLEEILKTRSKDQDFLEANDIDSIVNKFNGSTFISDIFSEIIEKLCDISSNLDDLTQAITKNKIKLSKEAQNTLDKKVADRKQNIEKLESLLAKEPGSLTEQKDINQLVDLLFITSGKKISLDMAQKICRVSGDLSKLKKALAEKRKTFGLSTECWSNSNDTDSYFKSQYEIQQRNLAFKRIINRDKLDKLSQEDIKTIAEYAYVCDDKKTVLAEIKKLRQFMSLENLNLMYNYFIYSFNYKSEKGEGEEYKKYEDIRGYLREEKFNQAELEFNEWSNAKTEQLQSYDISHLLLLQYLNFRTLINAGRMERLCKSCDCLSKLTDLEHKIVQGLESRYKVYRRDKIRYEVEIVYNKFGVTKEAAECLYKYIDNKKQEELNKNIEEENKEGIGEEKIKKEKIKNEINDENKVNEDKNKQKGQENQAKDTHVNINLNIKPKESSANLDGNTKDNKQEINQKDNNVENTAGQADADKKVVLPDTTKGNILTQTQTAKPENDQEKKEKEAEEKLKETEIESEQKVNGVDLTTKATNNIEQVEDTPVKTTNTMASKVNEQDINPKDNSVENKSGQADADIKVDSDNKAEENILTQTQKVESENNQEKKEKEEQEKWKKAGIKDVKDSEAVPINPSEQNHGKKKSKWPQILNKAGKWVIVVGVAALVVLAILCSPLNIGIGYVLSPLLLVALGSASWGIGAYFKNESPKNVEKVEKIVVPPLYEKNLNSLDATLNNAKQKAQEMIEGHSDKGKIGNEDNKNQIED